MKHSITTFFIGPIIVSLIALGAVWYYTGIDAFFLVLILSILEVTLSFDNAVVNAKVLDRMSPKWQQRFLTWGIAIAVFGTRFVLPILIVSLAVFASPWHITVLAFTDPEEYGHLLEGVKGSIAAFGGVFLLMVALKYFFSQSKETHWLEAIEKRFVRWGRLEALEIVIALSLITIISFFSPFEQASILVAGTIGLVLFILMEGLAGSLSLEGKSIAKSGFALFIYLNVLDSAFSLDGVVGAFALTTDLLTIVVGLGIGAYFVRSLTLYFVEQKTLTELVYLEHGAHWAILGLALAMLTTLVIEVPEIITGLVGLIFVSLSYRASLRELAGTK
jgi:uncharacterized protein